MTSQSCISILSFPLLSQCYFVAIHTKVLMYNYSSSFISIVRSRYLTQFSQSVSKSLEHTFMLKKASI